MITRDRLEKTTYGRGLLGLISRLTAYEVTDWGNNDSDTKSENRPGDRREVDASDLHLANVVTSLHRDLTTFDEGLGFAPAHALVLDIDHPCWLMPSTTPGHYHLYVDVPGGIPNSKYVDLLTSLANAGVIEWGYASASIARGFTSVRLPWIKKEKGLTQSD